MTQTSPPRVNGASSNAADPAIGSSQMLSVVYDELRRVAARHFQGEPVGHTLQPTALVHEVLIRILGDERATWNSPAQFFTVAAMAMRHLLIDHARRRCAAKRGGRNGKVSIDDVAEPSVERARYLVALDEALVELDRVDPTCRQVVELRFFAGLGVSETANVLGVSTATVKRKWSVARAWLQREIAGGDMP